MSEVFEAVRQIVFLCSLRSLFVCGVLADCILTGSCGGKKSFLKFTFDFRGDSKSSVDKMMC